MFVCLDIGNSTSRKEKKKRGLRADTNMDLDTNKTCKPRDVQQTVGGISAIRINSRLQTPSSSLKAAVNPLPLQRIIHV